MGFYLRTEDAAPPLRQISPKDVAAKETANSIGSCRSQPVPGSEQDYHFFLARDLGYINDSGIES